MDWIGTLPFFALLATCLAAVTVAGVIATVEWRRRQRIQGLMDRQSKSPAFRDEISRIEEELRTKRQQLGDFERQQAEAQQQISAAERLKDEISRLQHEKESLESVRVQVESLRAEKETLSRALEQASSDLERAKLDTRTLEQAAQAAGIREEETRARLEEAKRDNDAAVKEFQPIKAELDDLSSKLRGLRRERDDAKELIAQAERSPEVKEEVVALSNNLREKRAKLDALTAELDMRNEELTRATSRHEAIQAKLLETTGETSDEVSPEAALERLSDIWNPVLPLDRSPIASTKEGDCLERVHDYLKGHGLYFHERTICAFHTALKVANEAPLLVLAGISGTGKSLLPQRYAEAMGMNFQLVPVQPRWDGPQDLLGFYNFLEERYVPTEFLQALIQMHPFPDDWELPENTKHQSLKDQVLLVLLDEMNLARIEYYFSEFLSRLETRRTITDEKDTEQRIKASITLEAGPRTQPLRVYPGRNTLFVGTMNEDESTQSLSDKVVDRANVMRFARPTRVHDAVNGEVPKKLSGRLSKAVWKGWQSEPQLDRAAHDRVVEVTQALNDALNQIDRPFGHRLTRAVVEYVSMYPAHISDRVNRALADQIEMRVLPKLRGIDLDDRGERAVGEIQDVLSDLGDEALIRAFDAAQRPDDRFQWLGVERLED